MQIHTIGLTGGIASGKSSVARLFSELGVPVVDADRLAREVVARGTEGLQEIVETFGESMRRPDGSLDRERLGALVFADETARAKLEAITHPRIARAAASRIAELRTSGAPYILYEAALIVEKKMQKAFSALIVVAVEPETQLRRLMGRDGFEASAARARIDTQEPLARKLELADYVIRNDGDLEETRAQVERVHAALLERFAEPAGRARGFSGIGSARAQGECETEERADD
ncbi:MAG: dephospho-CoA kinase [Myxococcales bacterium]|nr:dephospho-CoA kinase [Myxococcales bacterium]